MSDSSIAPFLEDLRKGKLVAIPTETVYGLAASIHQPAALQNIFITKKRPFFDPLIVHVSSIEQAKSLVRSWPPLAEALAEEFWPGPLTLVLEKSEKVSDLITSGLSTVGIRMPKHNLTLKLIQEFGVPLAAPSANLFGRTSPTLAKHVRDEFPSEVVSVLDGGPCNVGIESTILAVSQREDGIFGLQILRQGLLKKADILESLRKSGFRHSIDFVFDSQIQKVMAPGQMKHHYMPSKPLILVQENLSDNEILQTVREKLAELPDVIEDVRLIKPNKIDTIENLKLSSSVEVAARELYAELRRGAETPCDILVFRLQPEHLGPDWSPLLDRLVKASSLRL